MYDLNILQEIPFKFTLQIGNSYISLNIILTAFMNRIKNHTFDINNIICKMLGLGK